MKFYRVAYFTAEDGSLGFGYFSTHEEAVAAADTFEFTEIADNPHTLITEHKTKCTKAAIIQLLGTYASHPDNG